MSKQLVRKKVIIQQQVSEVETRAAFRVVGRPGHDREERKGTEPATKRQILFESLLESAEFAS
jgi:hypothetical protein